MKYYMMLVLLCAMPSHADVYRTVDSNGNIIFTDDPEQQNAEKVTIDVAPSYVPPQIPEFVVDEEEASKEPSNSFAIPNYKISITAPVHDETFQNPENIAVTATVSPELNKSRGDKIIFKLDGKQIGDMQTPLNTVLVGVERGSHILVASVVDKSGKVLKSSKSALFHVHRHSIAN